jgi:hypothetical protein
MFKRVIYQEWANIVPIISFVLTFAVFAIATVRALRTPKDRREELARMPLDS